MRVLLLHLSDIHIKDEINPVVNRATAICDAVKNLDSSVQAILIPITGDIAYSGKENQYLIALEFFEHIQQQLKSYFQERAPVHLVLTPGNHDCDFSSDRQPARTLIANAVLRDPIQARERTIVKMCTAVQENFFQLRNVLSPDWQGCTPNYSEYLAYESASQIGSDTIRFVCCNTAWLSMLNEQQGSLYFPEAALPHETGESTVVITMFHHPYKWLQAIPARDFQKKVEANSDIILTGHEHDPARRIFTSTTGEHVQYIEGAVLQDSQDPAHSGFNVLILDTQSRQQRFFRG